MLDLGRTPDRCRDRWVSGLSYVLCRKTARLSVTVGLCCCCMVHTVVATASARASSTHASDREVRDSSTGPIPSSSALDSGGYLVSNDCPSRAQFLEEVLARSPAAAHASVRSILALSVVSIAVRERATYGLIRLPTGEVREVVGNSCTEVAGALALVVALKARAEAPPAIEDQPSKPLERADASGQTPTSSPVGASSGNSVPANASAASSPVGASSALPSHPLPQPEQAVSRRIPSGVRQASVRLFPKAFMLGSKPAPETRWALGGGAIAAFGPAPVGLFGAALFAAYQSKSFFPHLVLLGAEAAPYASARVQAATARYQWWASHADGCIQALRFEASTTLWLCAEVVGGLAVVTGQVQGPITHARTAREGWLSAGPAARVRLELAESYSLDVAASAGVPIIRHRTVFSEPDLVLHETGNLAGFLLLQLAWHSGG